MFFGDKSATLYKNHLPTEKKIATSSLHRMLDMLSLIVNNSRPRFFSTIFGASGGFFGVCLVDEVVGEPTAD